MLEKVISGGQTGVDQAALHAAMLAGLKTGGWAPKGWLTTAGPDLRLRDEWGLEECEVSGYAARTARNVRDSDATLRLAVDFGTPGERCTLNAVRKYGRVWLDVPLLEAPAWAELTASWLKANGVRTLNVAGNREGTKGLHVFDLAVIFLLPLFQRLRDD